MTAELLTIPEFCSMANISKTNAYSQINDRKLPAVKIGNKTMIRKTDAEAWLNALPPYVPRKPEA